VEERRQPSAADAAREQLRAWLPLAERRLQLAGVWTPVLEGVTGLR
jgi:hypothetical protein